MTVSSVGQVRAPGPAAVPMRRVEHCMGTVFSFDVRAPGVDRVTMDAAIARLHEIDAVYSPFRADSLISAIASGAMSRADASREVQDVLARCDVLSELTGGYFSARFAGRLDPSGYVKGWAIETVSDLLESAGSRNHCVNGGGDVQCVGRASDERPWRVGIIDPRERTTILDTVTGAGRFAVATSGEAERGAHITDPHTGAAPTALAAVTVIGSGVATVDAYATAAFAMGAAAPHWLAAQPGISALVVHADGRIWRSE